MPKAAEKRKANLVIVAFLLTMVLTPLSYYTVRSDRYDERFAWRMFSSVRMVKCDPRWTIGDPGEQVPIEEHFHMAWVGNARRGRGIIVDRMTEQLCETHQGQSVRLHMNCEAIDGTSDLLFDGTRNLCLHSP